MKKLASILFITIATIFCLKDIIVIIASDSDSYVTDINDDKDESDKTEKGDYDEKGDAEDWQLTVSEQLFMINQSIQTSYQKHKEKRYFPPYFEINSPPPEFI